jgi:hypothetical protein
LIVHNFIMVFILFDHNLSNLFIKFEKDGNGSAFMIVILIVVEDEQAEDEAQVAHIILGPNS